MMWVIMVNLTPPLLGSMPKPRHLRHSCCYLCFKVETDYFQTPPIGRISGIIVGAAEGSVSILLRDTNTGPTAFLPQSVQWRQ